MALTANARIGGYEIRSALGAGGMEVYRACDVRLGRDVAIEILPSAFTVDPNRLARFEREARVLASLNHPNIASIYGLEEITDAETPLRALILELVDGETLADRLLHGIELRVALDIARQIAVALDAAHEKGIVHRDLKPGNVMITPAGVVKVLDFGLAKTSEPTSSPDLTNSPTLSVDATLGGVLLGTAAYMSPEQARGQSVDKRCDVWAFGCVLYEMLTRRKAFAGATLTDTLAAIIEREPDWATLPAATPDGVRQLLKRCVAKNPARRTRDAGDIALELEAALTGLEQQRPAASRQRRNVIWSTAAAVALLALGVAVGLLARRGAPGDADAMTGVMTQITSDSGLTTEPSVSADGRLVAYASNRSGENNLDVYIQQVGGGASIRLTNDPADDREPDVSPDGSLVAFRSDRSPRGVYVAAALGGGARLVAPAGLAPKFSPDGRSIAFWTGSWLAPRSLDTMRRTFIVPAGGGSPTQVAKELASSGDPVWSPDGRSLLVFGRRTIEGPNTVTDWWWVPVDGRPAVATGAYAAFASSRIEIDVTDVQPFPGAWTREGVVFTGQRAGADNRGLWRIAHDEGSGRVTGAPMPLTNGLTDDVSPSLSRDRRIVFAGQTSATVHFAMPFDGNGGRPLGPLRHIRGDATPSGRSSLSEDGSLLVFPKFEFGAGGLWLRDMRTGQERQLAATPRTPLNPVISTDGRWVAYTETTKETGGASGPGVVYVMETSGGVPRRICEPCHAMTWTRTTVRL
jgi:serine/threonine protein kinase